MGELVQEFKIKTEKTMENIVDKNAFRASNKMVDYIFNVGAELFNKDMDTMSEAYLIRTGGKLTGINVYLGNLTARARAERDVYEQQADEIVDRLIINNTASGDVGVTQARAEAKLEAAALRKLVVIKEYEKNNFENLLSACQTMISYIQTALKMKNNERYQGRTMQDNG